MSDNIYGHNFHCPKCATHLTSLFLCGECGIRYDEWFASWQENQQLRAAYEDLRRYAEDKDNTVKDVIEENQRLRRLMVSKQKCVWCGAIREPNAERKKGESVQEILERQLGPTGCCAPDGDGHLWKAKELSDV